MIHCKKRFSSIPLPSRDVTYQTPPGREQFTQSQSQDTFDQNKSRNLVNFVYSVGCRLLLQQSPLLFIFK